MEKLPRWFKPVAVTVAILASAILIAGPIAVALNSTRSPEGYDQSRLHWNTKNSTRFAGSDTSSTAALVSQAVYPATQSANTPDLVMVYDPQDWQGGLAAASLLRPLNAVLLPASPSLSNELERLHPAGSKALGGTQLLLLNKLTLSSASVQNTNLSNRTIQTEQIADLLTQANATVHNVVVLDQNDPATALLAAPWLAYSNDLAVFDPAKIPNNLKVPVYALGNVTAPPTATRISGSNRP